MKKHQKHKRTQKRKPAPARGKLTVFAQLCNLIPGHLVATLAREHGIDKMARTFSAWSHVVALLYAQMTHALGLNDVCDALRHHCGWLARIRAAVTPSRNGLSHANKRRDPAMAEQLLWAVVAHLQTLQPRFGAKRRFKGLAGRFKRALYALDSTTIQLVVNCIDWAKHRRKKAAAKCHMMLDIVTMLPAFAVVESAGEHDQRRAMQACSRLKAGDIVTFDRGYLNFTHHFALLVRGIFFVTRTKTNVKLKVLKKRQRKRQGAILRDDEVIPENPASRAEYPQRLRRVLALVEVDGKLVEMEFLTNNFDWSAATIADIYRRRWEVEVFFKQIKQTLQLRDFLGNSANAVKWQVWTALLTYVLLRYEAFLSGWEHSFTRLFTLQRSVLWDRFDLWELLAFYGTAGGRMRLRIEPKQGWLPGLEPEVMG